MNSVLLNWVTVILGPLAIILLVAWIATGRKNDALRIAGGVAILIAMIAFGLNRYVLT